MEDLALARKTLLTAADGLEGIWLLLRLVANCLDQIPSAVVEFEAAMSPEAEAVSAAELVSEEIAPLVKRLRSAAAATPETLAKQFQAAKAALRDEKS